MSARVLVVAVVLLSAATSPAVSQAPDRPLRVATRAIAPFVEDNNGSLTGFSIELWDALKTELRVPADKPTVYPSVPELLNAVKTGKADLGIAAVSITSEREKMLDFSVPMFDSGLQILIRSKGGGNAAGSLFSILFSSSMLQLLGVIVLLVLIPAHIVWFVERQHSEGIIPTKKYFPGIFHAAWWSASTLATQADSMPRHAFARFIAVIWMFTGVVFVAYFTAQITTSMTVQQLQGSIKGPDDLPGKLVATTTGSTSAAYLRDHGVRVQDVKSIPEAYEALQKGDVDAVVFDAPVLLYYAAHDGQGKTQVVGDIFRKEKYGIVFPDKSPLRKRVNTALLTLTENGTYQKLYDKWFGGK